MKSGMVSWTAFCVLVCNGCSGCTSDLDCSPSVCCKKSFPADQTVCADKCNGLDCNSNDDCATGNGECCRNGKCVGALSCFLRSCKSNSGCDSGTYCCRKEKYLLGEGRCRVTCVDKDCDFDEDCGPPNQCCIAGKCAKDGCSECSGDIDCPSPRDSSPPWRVAVIVTAIVVLIAVGVSLFWYYKRKQASNATHGNGRSLQTEGTSTTGFNNPAQQQQGAVFIIQSSTIQCQQEPQIPTFSGPTPRSYDGYVIPNLDIPSDRTYEDPDAARNIHIQASPKLYPRRALDNPPPYPDINSSC